jgi:hypothetical protein
VTSVPPIPTRLADRPTAGGLVAPWINLRLRDGGVDFRGQHRSRAEKAITGALCQVDGQPLDAERAVLLGTDEHLRSLCFAEPPLHPECAAYTSRACPMVAGRMTHHPTRPQISEGPRGQGCYDPACDCACWIHPNPTKGSEQPRPAQPWWAVYVRAYMAVRDDNGVLLAVATPDVVRGVRLVSTPTDGRLWRTVPVADALADYTPPTTTEGRRT